jgi:hypothetical protein
MPPPSLKLERADASSNNQTEQLEILSAERQLMTGILRL